MNSGTWKIFSYKVTSNPTEADNGLHYSPATEELLAETYFKVQKNKIRDPQPLLKLIEQYPNVPAFKNYLTSFYNLKGKKDKAYSANHWLVKEHPDYLFGKLNLAAEYIETGRLEEVPKVLGQALDLKDLYPEREVFHITEFQSFLNVSCSYLLEIGEAEAVETRLEPAEKLLGKDNTVIKKLRLLLADKIAELEEEEEEWEFAKSNYRNYDKSVQTDEPPVFNHEEIWALYRHGMRIDHGLLRSILALPRETLLADLETVLADSLRRFEFFENKLEEENDEEWGEDGLGFPLHALFLLTELRATEKLPLILDHLRQGKDFLDFWYSDHVTETLWHFIYHLGGACPDSSGGQLELLKSFLFEPGLHYLSKWAVMSGVLQLGLHQPERREEVVAWYEALTDFFIENHGDASLADPEVVSSMVCELCDLQAEHLLPKIKRLYDLGLVYVGIPGTYKSVEQDIKRTNEHGKYQVFENIFDHYTHILKTWDGYMSEEDRQEQLAKWREKIKLPPKEPNSYPAPIEQLKRDAPKVGRNDPCPCGSGKKYKKCCMGK